MFSKIIWQECLPKYSQILKHPFITQMINGTLKEEIFLEYIKQDSLYLIDFSKALAQIACRTPDVDLLKIFLNCAQNAILAEHSLHEEYFKKHGINRVIEKNKICCAYTSFLIATTTTQTVDVGLASILPCFWVYREVGNHIAESSVTNNPYFDWIKTYSCPNFSKTVDLVIEVSNKAYTQATPGNQVLMKNAFKRSFQLEYDFWDEPYSTHQNEIYQKPMNVFC